MAALTPVAATAYPTATTLSRCGLGDRVNLTPVI